MWNIFDQWEMYMKNKDDREPMETLHEAARRFGNRSCSIYSNNKFIYYLIFQTQTSINFIQLKSYMGLIDEKIETVHEEKAAIPFRYY